MKFTRRVLLLSALVPLFPAAGAPPDLAPLEKWIARQAGVKTLIADFTQERHLRTVKKPLVSEGRMWLSATTGAFRWQAGDPPKLVAILTPEAEFCLMRPDKKEAEFFTKEALERENAGQGLAFLKAGFPESLESFQKQFEISELVSEAPFWRLELKPADGGAAVVVRKIVLFILQESSQMTAMQLHFRDGSWISNTFTKFQENPPIEPAQFVPDLAGYTVTRK